MTTPRLLLCFGLASALVAQVPVASPSGQYDWIQRASDVAGVFPVTASMAHDGARGRTVLAGGAFDAGFVNFGWRTAEWDGTAWSVVSPIASPPLRSSGRLVYDAARARIVMFGGVTPGFVSVNETWTYDGLTWSQLLPANSPPAPQGRAFDVMYDSRRSRVVLLLGVLTGIDVWTFDGTTWTQSTSAVRPPFRSDVAAAYDDTRDRVVMFGGLGASAVLADTWEWDGANWARIVPPRSPQARFHAALAYDGARARVVLIGGQSTIYDTLGDHWEWDGATWVQRFERVGQFARHSAELVHDATRESLVLWGGMNSRGGGDVVHSFSVDDTWVGRPSVPAAVASFGGGCHATALPPALSVDRRPWLGDPVTVQLENLLPGGTTALLVIGASRSAWAGAPLPLDLTPLGLVGCSLHVAADTLLGVPNAGGSGALSVTVPQDLFLLGTRAYLQAFAIDATANPAGIAASNALELAFGNR